MEDREHFRLWKCIKITKQVQKVGQQCRSREGVGKRPRKSDKQDENHTF